MRRALTIGLTLVLVSVAYLGTPRAADVAGAPLPPRARVLDDGRFASPLGFRATVAWYRKELKRRGANATFVGPVRFRDVTFVRVLPVDPRSPWAAVHIVLADGRTTIYILAASEAGVVAPKLEN
jgi:hypothetical protein